MKKMIFTVALAALLLTSAATVSAAGARRSEAQQTQRSCFVDADNNGTCDNSGTGCRRNSQGQQFTDADGDGICDNSGKMCRRGARRGMCGK